MNEQQKQIVIVGAGMAGLTAAAYLAREGHSVLLLEKNGRTGGLVNTFEKDGFFFDGGPRGFVNSGMVKPMLKDLDIQMEVLENKISIGIEDQFFFVESMDALQEYEQILCKLYPDSTQDIQKIMPVIHELSKYTEILYEFDNPNFLDLKADKKILKQLIPWTFKFLYALAKMRQYGLPMEDHLRQYTDNQSLTDILIQHFFRKTPSYFALGYFYVYFDYFYPRGGTGTIARLLHQKAVESGTQIQLNTTVTGIDSTGCEVVDVQGNHYPYDELVWAADLKTLYRSVSTNGLEEKTRQAIAAESKRVLAAKGAESVFIVFAAVNRPPAFFEERGGAHQFYTPSRQGLGNTHTSEKLHLLENFDTLTKADVLAWLEKFLTRNTYEISVPALRDPALAPDGQSGVMISCLIDYDLFEKLQQAGWYEEIKQTMEDRMVGLLSESLYPGFAEDILFKFSSSPVTINEVSGSTDGAITGWSFETDIPVVYTLKDIPKSSFTAIPHVYKAGQWSYTPAGMPIAMLTGWYAAQKIIK